MNLSATSMLECRERDGEAAVDRPEYVADALEADRKLGWREGKPLVPHPADADDGLKLGDDPTEAYSHYVRNDGLLRPDAAEFLQKLAEADQVKSVADAAEELNTDKRLVAKAAELHGVNLPLESDADKGEESDRQLEELQLPSGESLPLALLQDPPHTDPRVLTQLLATDGMSLEEAARYLSEELDTHNTASDIRDAARECNLLSDPSAEAVNVPIPDKARTQNRADTKAVRSPWE